MEIGSILLWNFVIPMMFFIIIFLGAIQLRYPHESDFQEDLNISLGIMGNGFYKIYEVGENNPKWFYYFFIMLGGFIYFTGDEICSSLKKIWSANNDTAQNIIDSINVKGVEETRPPFRMKGGNEK